MSPWAGWQNEPDDDGNGDLPEVEGESVNELIERAAPRVIGA